jgi:hypothetical protein
MGEEAQQARWSKAYTHVIAQKRIGCAVAHTARSTSSTPSLSQLHDNIFKLSTNTKISTMALLSPSAHLLERSTPVNPCSDLMRYDCTSPTIAYSKLPFSSLRAVQHLSSKPPFTGFDQTGEK